MRRREFITLLGGAAVMWPLTARTQQAMPVIGFIAPGSASLVGTVAALRQGLREAGFIEGQNVAIEFRWAENEYDRLPALAADLVRRRVTVITAFGVAAAVAAKAATTTIPTVFIWGEDPVSLGLVPSFNRPGANMTGVATLSSTVMAKRLALLRELAPRAQVLAALINPKNPNAGISIKEAQDAANILGRRIHIVNASSGPELDTAFETLTQLKAGALPSHLMGSSWLRPKDLRRSRLAT